MKNAYFFAAISKNDINAKTAVRDEIGVGKYTINKMYSFYSIT